MTGINLAAFRKAIRWPRQPISDEELTAIVRGTNRFIDFDETIFDNDLRRPFELLCGKPLAEFLSEEPFILQTWTSDPIDAVKFSQSMYGNPHLPTKL